MTAARLLLRCHGRVQGVGFRPWLARRAQALGLRGEVVNVIEAVQVDLHGDRQALQQLVRSLQRDLPAPARLERLDQDWLPAASSGPGPGVRIGAAPGRPLGRALTARALSPDLAPCPACLAELHDPRSRRHGYPFISCCACGPRYSIATAEPFRRAHTTLAPFPLCPACLAEFHDPADRRHHAETIGCPDCGPRLRLLDADGRPLAGGDGAALLARAAALLRGGGILALQGVGGFQLLVDAAQPDAVARLRARKRRPAKPLALLAADPADLEAFCHVGSAEADLLRSPRAPIVLLRRRWTRPPADARGAAPADAVAPGAPCLGVMLPASPLHHLLSRRFGGLLVATSGNRSGEMLALSEREARQRLADIADAFLVHDRAIARPLDDSLLQVVAGRPALLRRARGYAPDPVPCARPPRSAPPVLALGGDLKLAPAVGEGGRVWMAPHLGDAADPRCLERLRGAAATPPGWRLVRDGHPGYLSHGLVDRLRPTGDGVETVPHHLAHALAAMAEHDLRPPLLALTCDGLGYGPPGSGPGGSPLWGGELLLVEAGGWRRLGHLRPLPLPGGERAHREPPRVALGLLHAAGLPPDVAALTAHFGPADLALLRRALAAGLQAPHTTSLGRLFDGVASLLDLCQRNSYEGEAALALQAAAERHAAGRSAAGGGTAPSPAAMAVGPGAAGGPLQLDWGPLLSGLLAARAGGAHRDALAWRFHQVLADGLAGLAERGGASCGATTVVLAGGCFQNRLLTDLCREALARRGLRACWSEAVPCGDGGLALGQLWAVWAGVAMTPAEPSPGPGPRHVSGHLRPHPLDRVPPSGGMPRS